MSWDRLSLCARSSGSRARGITEPLPQATRPRQATPIYNVDVVSGAGADTVFAIRTLSFDELASAERAAGRECPGFGLIPRIAARRTSNACFTLVHSAQWHEDVKDEEARDESTARTQAAERRVARRDRVEQRVARLLCEMQGFRARVCDADRSPCPRSTNRR